MTTRACRLAAAFLAAGVCTCLEAAHPLLTEDTGTQGAGNYQLEMLVDKSRDHPEDATVRKLQTTAQLSYGLLENVDLQLGMPYLRQNRHDTRGRHASSGPLDTTLALKWRYFEHDAFSLALKGGFSVPTGDEDRGFGSGRTALGAVLIVSYQPGPWAFHSHAGYRWNNNSVGERKSLAHLSAAVTYQATDRIRLIADLSADTNPDRSDSSLLRYGVLGAIYSAAPNVDLDAGFKLGHGNPATDRTLLFGATLRW